MDEKANILIVDDDAAVGETLSDILEAKGYNVVVATDGPTAIHEVKKQHFALAFVDIVMPDMSGVETLRRIKELDPNVRTMIMTGHSAMEKSISDALDVGVDRVLFKPFNVESIVELISRETEITAEEVSKPAVDHKEHQIQPEDLRLVPEEAARGKPDGKGSVLIIDDDINMCDTLSDILEEKGYRVVIAPDGPKAIEEVKNQHFDLALVDIAMPDMNGIETLRRIRAIDPQITAVIMTGHRGLDAFVPEDLEAKVEGILSKPLDIETIVEILEDKARARTGPPLVDLQEYEVQPETLSSIPEETASRKSDEPFDGVQDKQGGILIVDDDVGLCETLSDVLEEKGYGVVIARDGPGAVAEAKGRHFDLALIDIMMPGMNGIETLREIREADPETTTMIMTGHSALEDSVSEALEAGVDGVLYKPFEIDTIVEMIESKAEVRAGPPLIDLKKYQVQPEALRLISEEAARKWDLIPLRIEGNSLVVAMADPTNLYAVDDVRALSKMEVEVLRADLTNIRDAINLQYRAVGEIEEQIGHIATAVEELAQAQERIPTGLITQAAVVRTIDLLVAQAVKDRASDIHIEPQRDRSRVRYRIDGVLHDTLYLPPAVHKRLISRVKVLAKMDIAEWRRPQDGQFTISTDGHEVDIRAATVHTPWGETAVLRVLDKSMTLMDLLELGFLPDSLKTYQKLIQHPFGMILISGPTGSGKTTTLYASINKLNTEDRNIVTIEDPIEYHFTGMKQIQVDPQVALTLARGLRAIMRLDPDIILVGEIHDVETVNTAIQAALTGHLVLSSVHANDAVGVLFRLMDLGIEPFLITSSVVGIVAQRLVRRVCPHCLSLRDAPEEERVAYEEEIGETRTQFYYGAGCNFCANTGYLGRTGIFEVLVISDEIRHLLLRNAGAEEIKDQATKEGIVPLRHSGMLKVKDGLTTPREVLRNVFY